MRRVYLLFRIGVYQCDDNPRMAICDVINVYSSIDKAEQNRDQLRSDNTLKNEDYVIRAFYVL